MWKTKQGDLGWGYLRCQNFWKCSQQQGKIARNSIDTNNAGPRASPTFPPHIAGTSMRRIWWFVLFSQTHLASGARVAPAESTICSHQLQWLLILWQQQVDEANFCFTRNDGCSVWAVSVVVALIVMELGSPRINEPETNPVGHMSFPAVINFDFTVRKLDQQTGEEKCEGDYPCHRFEGCGDQFWI